MQAHSKLYRLYILQGTAEARLSQESLSFREPDVWSREWLSFGDAGQGGEPLLRQLRVREQPAEVSLF